MSFVLVGTSHPGNVGATARAMRTMGLRNLVLVSPRTPSIERHPEAIARASGAVDVLESATTESTLADALARCSLAVAVSAETREFGPRPQPPEPIVQAAHDEAMADPHHRIAFVFGSERNGLSIEELQRCQAVCSIPGGDDYASLNLAQAAQVVAYCLRAHERLQEDERLRADEHVGAHARMQRVGAVETRPVQRYATQAQVDALFVHLERALIAIEFLDPRHPKKLMPRLRRLFARTRLEDEEVALLRGICTQIEKTAQKTR